MQISIQINIAMRKVATTNLTAGMLSRNFKETAAFHSFRSSIWFHEYHKGTPKYWKKFLHDVLAMVRQMSLPTSFLTLSFANLRWNELVSVISGNQ